MQFWLTLGSLITLVGLLIFILTMGFVETLIITKPYCVFLIPILLYLMFQFAINYYNLTDKEIKEND